MVVELVQDGVKKGKEITVGAMAGILDIDRSAASRIVSDAIQAGHLRRVASQGDAPARAPRAHLRGTGSAHTLPQAPASGVRATKT